MVAAAADSSTWVDLLKFVPGWLAFLRTAGTWIYKGRVRRRKVALGPDDDVLRQELTAARKQFKAILAQGGVPMAWFDDEERVETAQRLLDLTRRRQDADLRRYVLTVCMSWERVSVYAPVGTGNASAAFEPSALQIASAEHGVTYVQKALTRMNELESRTHGRS
ncbi:hypothetical protein ACFVYV_40295 [Streptomyces mirabilis]|uniref:hypothetical protein n=1 Tax=Streptomyces mirabilis TaxID=68239 RepID=UPI0036DE7C45